MKRHYEIWLMIALAALLLTMGLTLGWREAWLGLIFSAIWFFITMVLLARPPGIPELTHQRLDSDQPLVTRKELLPKLPGLTRLRVSLGVSCGVCIAVWMMLGLIY